MFRRPKVVWDKDRFNPTCHCVRCDAPLPNPHTIDHVCSKCFDDALQEMVAWLDEQVEEMHDDSKEA